MRNILVYVEAAEGKAKNVGLEILTPAKVAAEGGEVIAAVIGKDVAEAAKQAIAFGADKAVVVDGAQYEVYNTDVYANALTSLLRNTLLRLYLQAQQQTEKILPEKLLQNAVQALLQT